MTPAPSSVTNAAEIDQQAALWFTRGQSQRLSPAEQQALADWLQADKRHQQAYQEVAQLWRDLAQLPRPASAPASAPATRQARPVWWRPLLHTAASLFLLAALILPYSQLPSMLMNNMTLYAYDQPREITLPDGSKVFLNRDSQLRVSYSQQQRQLWLDQGEVYFKVTHNPYRPFVVHTANSLVQVVGTEFDIRRSEDKVSVAVRQGTVAAKAQPQDQATLLHAGDSAILSDNAPYLQRSKQQLDEIGSWRQGQLRFYNRPLGELLAELRRYYPGTVTLADSQLANLPVSGTLNLQQPEDFFQALPLLLAVKVVYPQPDNVLILPAK